MFDEVIVTTDNSYLLSGIHYEKDYSSFVLKMCPKLFPDFFAFEVELEIESEGCKKKCDLVLVRKDYSSWWVVEVELSTHSVASHIRPQVSVFSEGYYGGRHAEKHVKSIMRRSNYEDLDQGSLYELLDEKIPNVLIIMDKSPSHDMDNWNSLEDIDRVSISILKSFRQYPSHEPAGFYQGPDLLKEVEVKIKGGFGGECFVFENARSFVKRSQRLGVMDSPDQSISLDVMYDNFSCPVIVVCENIEYDTWRLKLYPRNRKYLEIFKSLNPVNLELTAAGAWILTR